MNDITSQCMALVAGRHGDPFALLGPHAVDGGTLIRTFQPQALTVVVVDGHGERQWSMKSTGIDGLFEVTVAEELVHYTLLIDAKDGKQTVIEDPYRFGSVLGDIDLHLLGEGKHFTLFEKLGAHPCELEGVKGTDFCVWAPNAKRVSVVGNFNDWDGRRHSMRRHPSNGLWEIFIPQVGVGSYYKYELLDANSQLLPLKTDPFAQYHEKPPGNAAIVYQSQFKWRDSQWMKARPHSPDLEQPISIYEVHLGSWKRITEEGGRSLTYREHAEALIEYVVDMGFTHIELLPVTEHPFDGSWGYQPIGLFAPTQRFGDPDDFRYFVNACHVAGIGVIIDWVPAHFPRDEHGLARFDGTALYEHADPRKGEHRDWGTLIFNYGRQEVANYLLANAIYWLQEFHIDGLRVDAVASMLYLDYSREEGEWLPNANGGNENLEAVKFLQQLNELVHLHGGVTYAEESTAWPGVSRPTFDGGLGFTYKWNMGWMNDTLKYMQQDPLYRNSHHDGLTFGLVYAFTENFILPISHDEVVHGKGSLIGRMPGDAWQKFANLRTYLGFMFSHPGKKLLFMGCEFAQYNEWDHEQSLDWHLLDQPSNAGIAKLVRDLNRVYRTHSPLHEVDFEDSGFEWINWQDAQHSVTSWIRRSRDGSYVICISNFTPVPREAYSIGVPEVAEFMYLINTDETKYGGSGIPVPELLESRDAPYNDKAATLSVTLPPLATLVLKPVKRKQMLTAGTLADSVRKYS